MRTIVFLLLLIPTFADAGLKRTHPKYTCEIEALKPCVNKVPAGDLQKMADLIQESKVNFSSHQLFANQANSACRYYGNSPDQTGSRFKDLTSSLKNAADYRVRFNTSQRSLSKLSWKAQKFYGRKDPACKAAFDQFNKCFDESDRAMERESVRADCLANVPSS